MKWEEYQNNNPALSGVGFWTEVLYSLDSAPEQLTKGFVAIQENRILVIGHVWFASPSPGSHFYLFEGNGNIFGEHKHQNNKLQLGARPKKIVADISDKLVYLATSFREEHPEYSFSLDNCMRNVLRLTEKRK